MVDNALLFLIISTILAIGGYFVIERFKVPRPKKFELLVRYLGGISVVLVIYNLYINFRANERIEKNRVAYNTISNIQNNYLGPQRELLEQYPEGYFLYASMNQDTDLKESEPENYDPIKRKQVEVYTSLRIFQTMEDFLSTAAFDLTGLYVWVNNFLMWMQSPILQKNWQILSFNYSDDTQEFVTRIIEKSNDLIDLRKQKGSLTEQDYENIAKNFSVKYR